MPSKSEIASMTAKGGFENEKEVADKFTNWKHDKDAQQWLKIMNYDVATTLKHFCGALPPKEGCSDLRRMYMDEFTDSERENLKNFLKRNMVMIISDVIRGRGRFAAEWMLVIHKYQGYRWKLLSINETINHYVGDHEVEFTGNGGIRLGGITMQRKGGDNGKATANQLQFKGNPLEVFQIP